MTASPAHWKARLLISSTAASPFPEQADALKAVCGDVEEGEKNLSALQDLPGGD